MADDAAARKKAVDDAEATATATALVWPTGEYDSFILYLLVHVLIVYVVFIDVSVLYIVRAHLLRYRYKLHIVIAMFIIYSWIKLIKKVLIFPASAIQRVISRLNGRSDP